MQFRHITIDGTSEEVARFLELQPLPDSVMTYPRPSRTAIPSPAMPGNWAEFRTGQTGKMKEFLEFLIENKGKTTGDKLQSRFHMNQNQINAFHATLNANARKLTGESRLITTKKVGRTLQYFIRSEVLPHLLRAHSTVSMK